MAQVFRFAAKTTARETNKRGTGAFPSRVAIELTEDRHPTIPTCFDNRPPPSIEEFQQGP